METLKTEMAPGEPKGSFYNLTKYRTLFAIVACVANDIPATSYSISVLTGMKQKHVVKQLIYYESYILPKRYSKSPDGCRLKYKLSAKGKRVFVAFKERHRNGLNLNIRKFPKRMNWEGVKILPGYDRIEKLQELYS